ncbi:Umecyanin like [Actinidia chinensis var. chinensis]|uniref:Umecyanin like n=1 Tax=Actinidia chinensis var. chinensis TaxID=1590841 RepID=A0A2R6QZQ4_ACTCC|nr:Umecyanin like [Actinidia chinensis var. chinensis]
MHTTWYKYPKHPSTLARTTTKSETQSPPDPANVTLTSAGDHYYICTFGSHCQAGQKLAITVSATPGAATPPTTPSTPTTPATPSPTSSTAPEACPPEAPTPKADGPTATSRPEVVPPPPDSASSAVFAGFSLTVLGFAVGFFL